MTSRIATLNDQLKGSPFTPTWYQGTTVPTDTTAGYPKGAIFLKTDGGANTTLYVNEGSSTSCDFNAMVNN
jgi:hypothetical protein